MKGDSIVSVIMPIYNLEKYLRDAIESVVKQTIGFVDNIEIILVNDGSTDGSKAVCLEYVKKYPDNITYIEHEKNKGVSAARNLGAAHARGKYVNFFDGDDIWDEEAFEKAVGFFEKNYEIIDFVACRQRFFEKLDKWHGLDFKFKKGDRVINIDEEPRAIQLSVTSVLFKREAIKGNTYNESMKYGEDTRFVSEVLMDKCRYGLVSGSVYKIRKRDEGTSATQHREQDKTAYITIVREYYKHVHDLCKERFGEVKPYFQFLILNGLKWRAFSTIPDDLGLAADEKDEYRDTVIDLIKGIDDDIICKAINTRVERKLDLLTIKHGDISGNYSFSGEEVWYNNIKVGKVRGVHKLFITDLAIVGRKVHIKGILREPRYLPLEHFNIIHNGKREAVGLSFSPDHDIRSIEGNVIVKAMVFEHMVKLEKGENIINFEVDCAGNTIALKINDENKKNRFGGTNIRAMCKRGLGLQWSVCLEED